MSIGGLSFCCFTNKNQATSHTPRRCRQDAHDIQTLGAEACSFATSTTHYSLQMEWKFEMFQLQISRLPPKYDSPMEKEAEKSQSAYRNLRKVKTVLAEQVDFCLKIDEEVIDQSRCKQYLMKPFLLLRTHTSWQAVTLRMIVSSCFLAPYVILCGMDYISWICLKVRVYHYFPCEITIFVVRTHPLSLSFLDSFHITKTM